jgi:hypothetical protein
MTVINTVTLWNREIREELMFTQTIKKFLAYFGTRSFNTIFCNSLLPDSPFSNINPVDVLQSISWRFILVLSYHLSHSTLLDLIARITYRGEKESWRVEGREVHRRFGGEAWRKLTSEKI